MEILHWKLFCCSGLGLVCFKDTGPSKMSGTIFRRLTTFYSRSLKVPSDISAVRREDNNLYYAIYYVHQGSFYQSESNCHSGWSSRRAFFPSFSFHLFLPPLLLSALLSGSVDPEAIAKINIVKRWQKNDTFWYLEWNFESLTAPLSIDLWSG